MTPTPSQIQHWSQRPMSWSQFSSWHFDPTREQWYRRYILGEATPETPALKFGKRFAESIEWKEPMAPVMILPSVEHKLEATLDDLQLVGFMDSYCPDTSHIMEYKTGQSLWDQVKVDGHQQFDFYLLMIYLNTKQRPENHKLTLQWLPTKQTINPDFTTSFGFALNPDGTAPIHTFETSRTTLDILRFAKDIQDTRKAMEDYIAKLS